MKMNDFDQIKKEISELRDMFEGDDGEGATSLVSIADGLSSIMDSIKADKDEIRRLRKIEDAVNDMLHVRFGAESGVLGNHKSVIKVCDVAALNPRPSDGGENG